MPDQKLFDKPLNTFIEEEVPVKKNRFDPQSGRITSVTQMEKVKTMYIDAPAVKHRCKDGEHVFKCVDNHRYIFSCLNCRYSRKVYPTTYEFKDGKLIHRITGNIV